MTDHKGSCLCGKVSFNVAGELRDVIACHCGQCRKQTGLYYAATNALDEAFSLSGEEHITWYQASDDAKRGFCKHCGSALFWKKMGDPDISILAGSFDEPSGLEITEHIYVAHKGDFYKITDDLPQRDE